MKKRSLSLFLALALCMGLCVSASAAETRPWEDEFDFPTEDERASCPTDQRSPYLASWLKISSDTRFDAYCADIKADYLPCGTYCCPANFFLDLSSLREQYESVTQEGISGYAGLQRLGEGKGYTSILSFWDIFCTDEAGNTTVIRPERIYPAIKTSDDYFDHEGTGSHTIFPFDWQAGHWYRMLLRCGTSEETGNTTVEQWVKDLTADKWFHICTYDTGIKDSSFIGPVAFFLENYLSQYAGEVRSMEIANIRIHTTSDGEWHDVTSTGDIVKQFGSGSWQAGADENAFYMITTGVTGKGSGVKTETLNIQNTEDGDPLEELDAEVIPFGDVPEWCADAVNWAVSQKITDGVGNNRFAPSSQCTNAMILTFLWRAADRPDSEAEAPIPITGDEWYAGALRWAAEKGMIGEGFELDAPCTRADAVNYIWQAFGKQEAGAGSFTDVRADADYSDAVNWAVENGLTNGYGNNEFRPDNVCSRGEIVTFLHRAYVPEVRLK